MKQAKIDKMSGTVVMDVIYGDCLDCGRELDPVEGSKVPCVVGAPPKSIVFAWCASCQEIRGFVTFKGGGE